MTKINTSVINSTYLKPRAGMHFRKAQPAESHVLVQTFNAGDTASRVYDNTTAIPSQGNFTATPIWTDTTGAGIGKFSPAPDSCVVYANGKDTCVWGGAEYRTAAFVVGDLVETVLYDYSQRVNNTLDDSDNIATIYSAGIGIDANTMLYLALNNNVTDTSPTSPHTVNNDAPHAITFSNSIYKFGYSGVFDGTSGYLVIPDNDDFDLSGGVWTIDFQMYMTPQAVRTIYYQKTDATHYISIYIHGGSAPLYNGHLHVDIIDAGSDVNLVSGQLFNSSWYHIAVVENGDSYYLFVNGILVSSATSANRLDNLTGSVYIGATDTPSNYFEGYIDEFKVSNSARWTSAFTPPVAPFSSTVSYVYLGSTRPIQGSKFYVKTANVTAATASVAYWANSSWTTASSIVDGTATSGGTKTLGQTGSITFTSTVGTAKTRVINNQLLYWYLFTFTAVDATTTVSYVTVDAPMQQLVDLWDGSPIPIGSFLYNSGTDQDYTSEVFKQDFYTGNLASYATLTSMATTSYLSVGFVERSMGVYFQFVPASVNAVVATMTVSYWSGSAWVAVSGLVDGTATGNVPFSKTGIISWDAPSEGSESKKSFSGNENLYYYKISFSATLSTTVLIDYVTGIPAPITIHGYSLAIQWQNRVWLLGRGDSEKNVALCSAYNTVCVFNGFDTQKFEVGDDSPVIAAGTLFSRFGSGIYDNLLLVKVNEVWMLDGTGPPYKLYRISDGFGCTAPGTLKVAHVSYEVAPGITKHVAIWQSSTDIVLFDGNTVSSISDDISNYFDPAKTECISAAWVGKSEGFFDERRMEYYWLFASGSSATELNTELVYDVMKKKWFLVSRGTGKMIKIGFPVLDTNGFKYDYASLDTGYLERLEYGNTFDGGDIISKYRTGDIPLGGWMNRTEIRKIKHLARYKSTTTNSVTISHYGDCANTADATTVSASVNSSTLRVVKKIESVNWTGNVFHSFECQLTTTNESVGYEPLGLGVFYKDVGEDIK
jgi:hypothetical protein